MPRLQREPQPSEALPTLTRQPGFHSRGCGAAEMDKDASSPVPGSPGTGRVPEAGGCASRQRQPPPRATRPTGGSGNGGEAGRDPSLPARLREAGGTRPARDRAVWKKREKEQTGTRRDSAPDPCTRRALVPRGRGCRPAPARRPLEPGPPRRPPPRPPGAPRGSRSPLTALRAGEAAGGHGGSRRRCSRCGGRDMLGRALFIAAGSGSAARLWGAAPPPPAPPHTPRARRAGPGRPRPPPVLWPWARPAERAPRGMALPRWRGCR